MLLQYANEVIDVLLQKLSQKVGQWKKRPNMVIYTLYNTIWLQLNNFERNEKERERRCKRQCHSPNTHDSSTMEHADEVS